MLLDLVSTLPHGRSLKILRGRGVLRAGHLEEKYGMKLNWYFLGGERGDAEQKSSMGEHGYFLA